MQRSQTIFIFRLDINASLLDQESYAFQIAILSGVEETQALFRILRGVVVVCGRIMAVADLLASVAIGRDVIVVPWYRHGIQSWRISRT